MRTTKTLPVLLGIAFSGYLMQAAPQEANALWFGGAVDWVKGKASGAADFVSSTAKSAASAASNMVGAAWDRTKSVATTAYDYAKAGAQKVAEKTKAAYDYTQEKAGQAVDWAKEKGKQALDAAKRAGKKAVDLAGQAGKKVVDAGKKAYQAGKEVVAKAYNWAKDKVNIIAKYGEKILSRVKEFARTQIVPLANKFLDWVKEKLGQAITYAKKAAPAIAQIEQVIKTARTIIDVIQDPQKYIEKGKAALVDFLADTAMRVLRPALVKVNAFAVGWVMKILKHPVSTAIATAINTAITSAVAAVTAGVGAALAPVLQPLTKWTADRMIDWLIDKCKEKIGELIFEKSKSLLKQYVIRPLIDKAYDALIAFLKQKFPNAWKKGEQILQKAQEYSETAGKVLDVADQGINLYKKGIKKGEKLKRDIDKVQKKMNEAVSDDSSKKSTKKKSTKKKSTKKKSE